MATWKITVRYGLRHQRYHTLEVEASDVRDALRRTADRVGDEIAEQADLLEVRRAVNPVERGYLGDG